MRRPTSSILALLGFVLLALAVTWPLPAHLTTRLLGSPGGDTGVYVWNLWIFRHEIIRHNQFPFLTDHIFAFMSRGDLSAHNYTVFANLLGLPLISVLGVVGAFNVIYWFMVALSGFGTYLLVKRLVGSRLEAWIAGAAFAASPVLLARGTAHFSLAAAAPLPIFLLCLLRALESRRVRDALLVGVVVAWAGYCDPYFAIYCVLMAALMLVHNRWKPVRAPGSTRHTLAPRLLDGVIVALSGFVIWRIWHGATALTVGGLVISLRTLHTPVLLLTGLGLARLQMALRLRFAPRSGRLPAARLAGLSAVATVAAAALLSPVLIGLGRRVLEGRFPVTPINWRSSPPGLDLVELVLPNPNHPWFGGASVAWITASRPDAFPEFVGSVSFVVAGVLALSVWRQRRVIPRVWLVFTAAFTLLALGPFIQVGRVNTYIPGPWALLRYVPGVELARSPSRFAIVAALGMSVAFAFALAGLRREWPARWRIVFGVIGLLLAIELVPVPRQLFDAVPPGVYSRIAAERNESLRVLELPVGIRDGTSSIGDFSADTMFYQTAHRKPLLGGYLSRVSEERKVRALDIPVFAALYALSAGGEVPSELLSRAIATREQFLADGCLGFVVIHKGRASAELRSFAIRLFDLIEVGEDRERELFVPSTRAANPRCSLGPSP